MRLFYSEQYLRSYRKLPQTVQRRVEQKLGLFLANSRHPSLRIKRLQGQPHNVELWEGSITMNYRFIFVWVDEGAYLVDVGPHKIVDRL